MGQHVGNTAGTKLPIEVLTADEVERLADQCSRRAPTGIRNRAMIWIMYRCTMRIAEVLALEMADWNEERRELNIRHGKGDKQRLVGVDPMTSEHLRAWIVARRERVKGYRRLFCTLAGRPIKQAYIRELLPRLASRAGIEKRVHPHGLRHSGASELLERGASLLDLQDQLGHANANVTSKYLHQINPKGRRERISRIWEGEGTEES